MIKQFLICFIFLLANVFASSICAEPIIFYENNFESGKIPKSFPYVEHGQVWTLPKKFPEVYGEGNFFNLSRKLPHSGNFSLRFTYDGLNGFCNTCGHKSDKHITTNHDNANYYISANKKNLTIADDQKTKKNDDGIKAQPGKVIYNKSGGYSKWLITSITNQNAINDRLNLQLIKAGIQGEKTITGGDTIAVTRQCGIDGIVGISKGKNQINRRSDCNRVILWFANVSKQKPGSSLYRRQYLKSDIISTGVRQKLHYLRPDRKGSFSGELVLFGQSMAGKIKPEFSGTKKYGTSLAIFKSATSPELSRLEFKQHIWYYIEEQYKAATVKIFDDNGNATKYNNDGEYRLWFAESGSEPTDKNSPILELTKLTLPPIIGGKGTHISFWGNTQHKTDNHGYWYIDDVKISNAWNGPIQNKLKPQ